MLFGSDGTAARSTGKHDHRADVDAVFQYFCRTLGGNMAHATRQDEVNDLASAGRGHYQAPTAWDRVRGPGLMNVDPWIREHIANVRWHR